ncbi:Peroxisomal nicotinamide adenine dinucleotide carrier [Arachis hypogaea]|nr:Peroxisomal nicotinamide adenine dinucleotide carrier [Arachis hypogaea]
MVTGKERKYYMLSGKGGVGKTMQAVLPPLLRLVPVEGVESPLYALEINSEKSMEEFRATSQKLGDGVGVVKHEEWERLYGGLMPSLVGIAASQGVYYYFYQIFRNKAEVAALEQKRLGIGDGSVGMFSSLIVVAFSGCVNVLLTNSIWVVVTRMQTHRKESSRTPPNDVLLNVTEQALVPTEIDFSGLGMRNCFRQTVAGLNPLSISLVTIVMINLD